MQLLLHSYDLFLAICTHNKGTDLHQQLHQVRKINSQVSKYSISKPNYTELYYSSIQCDPIMLH